MRACFFSKYLFFWFFFLGISASANGTIYFRYDLSELSGHQYTVKRDNSEYVFGICSEPKKPCNDNAGACLVTGGQSSSMGLANSQLHFLDEQSDSPVLVYESGSVCETMNKQWTTRIEFICQTEGMTARPTIVENSNCSLIIHFVTKLVCKNEVNTFDLESQ